MKYSSIVAQPVFLVGVPRSGTSWVQKVLLEHSNICGGQETHFFLSFGHVIKRFFKTQNSHRKAGLYWYWEEEELCEEILKLWTKTIETTIRKKPGSSLLLEKTPDHLFFIEEIKTVLPEARFIHVVRDSRSVVSSLLAASRSEWGKWWAPSNPKDAANYWNTRILSAKQSKEKLSNNEILEIFYEDLLINPDVTFKKVFDFINVSISDDELRASISQHSLDRSRAGNNMQNRFHLPPEPAGFIRQGSSSGWRSELSLREKLIVWKQTRKLMYEHGYTWKGLSR